MKQTLLSVRFGWFLLHLTIKLFERASSYIKSHLKLYWNIVASKQKAVLKST